MPNSTPVTPLWIDTPQKLAAMSADLQQADYLCVDTESNSLYVYYEQVCLIQISTASQDYLLDPLVLKDLSCLAGIFANPKQEKIFHASEYDVICLKRDFNFTFANIFDTMIAARILGEQAVGLAALLNSRMGLELDKKYQRANWAIRPLTPEMLTYACQDSHFLYELRNILAAELKEKGLWELALEDFHLACRVEGHAGVPVPQTCWKVAGSTAIDGQEAAILQLLVDFRENLASKQNVPPFKIITNEVLMKLIKEVPTTYDELKAIRGTSPRFIERHANEILDILKQKESLPPLRKERKVRPSEAYLNRLDSLREWRKLKGKELKVESDVILPRDFVENVAGANPTTQKELKEILQLIPWRNEHFGKEILSVLKKQETE
ncbi:MAG: HRDC domain-containing protein [Anaerolineaceae bacterium]|nr:HRDC domain-containing protein [Anaerolineaceae bacterium]